MGGYGRGTTPTLKRMADGDDGRAFDSCFSHGIWTLSSSASILTGTVPSAHGVGMSRDALPADFRTVPERLHAAGYHTECLSPNPHLSAGTNLDQGFATFTYVDKRSLHRSVGLRPVLSYALSIRRNGGGLTLDPQKQTPDYMMNEHAKRRLGRFEGRAEPFFLYVHYSGPHRPYYPPRRFRERFTEGLDVSADRAGEIALDHHDNLFQYVADGCPFTDSEWAALRAMYDGEIAFVDELVGDLFDRARSLDLGPTVVVVTGDHGEYFGEQRLLGHNVGVHDAVSNVPLVVEGFDEIADYRGPVQHADVMRTLLDVAGASTDGVQGVDLRSETREYAVVQRGGKRCRQRFEKLRDRNPEFDASRYHDRTLSALRTLEYKYLKSADRGELFRLPDEGTDVCGDEPAVCERLDAELDEWLDTVGRLRHAGRTDSEYTEDMKERLEGLGYLVE